MDYKTPIAVVGMGGVFPGASDLETYWGNIESGISAICDVPDNRWIVKPDHMVSPVVAPDKALTKRAGLIRDFHFDPSELSVDHDLLRQLDPMYHLVLTAGRQAVSSCAMSTDAKKRTGVILAAIALPTDSSSFFTREVLGKQFEHAIFGDESYKTFTPISKAQCLASRVTSLPASLLAKALGLEGGTYTLDAACSSSLYSIKLACDELHSGRSDVMLAGGVSRPESLFTQTGFTQLTALSPSGVCAPFDKNADGLVVGEGAGVIVLKRLDDARKDGDKIHALLHGSGLTNDIGGNLLAPDTEGQVRAMELAYKSAGWSPYDVDHIECHGTGTPVGDSIELKSLRTIWGDSGWKEKQCALGSVKSMIGHLLTGAGIAGTIKTILALNHKTLPPSLNYTGPKPGGPLIDGPFRVQTSSGEWKRKSKHPRRAAMSAFGFGGINAHVLVEEWDSSHAKTYQVPRSALDDSDQAQDSDCPVAIIGMGTFFTSINNLRDFQEAVFNGKVMADKQATDFKWKDARHIAQKHLNGSTLPVGNYMEELSVSIGEFHIPPNEIPDILPQHLLMLKAAAQAMEDARLPKREDRPRMGTAIGMGFDFEATNFNIRWNLENAVESWKNNFKLELDETKKKQWTDDLKNTCGPPLSPSRTTGALGGIIASRVAKEFRLGGPSFIVSCEDASGLKALEIGIRSLQNNETDTFLAGAVDLPGEIRNIISAHNLRPFSESGKASPFDQSANGPLPGEGAAAVVLKRLDKAMEDGDRIYCVIKGMGNASAGGIDEPLTSGQAYLSSLNRAVEDACIQPSQISYVETHGSASAQEDAMEASALNTLFSKNQTSMAAIGATSPIIGHTGAVSGLASLIKASLCLYQQIIPPLPNFSHSGSLFHENGPIHIPTFPQYWMRNRIDGPRTACVASITTDGNCTHAILEEADNVQQKTITQIEKERLMPLGNKKPGLFLIEGNSSEELLTQLSELDSFADNPSLPSPFGPDDIKRKDIMHILAHTWHTNHPPEPDKAYALSMIAGDVKRLKQWIAEAEKAIKENSPKRFAGPDGICYTPEPIGPDAEIALVYPGSGNHYIGMGLGIGTNWPEILRNLDSETHRLKSQLLPDDYVPHRISWEKGWDNQAMAQLNAHASKTIIGQVSHGVLATDLIRQCSVTPSAIISYSLGESAALFATRTWTERDRMLKRMESTDLFTDKLSGACTAARKQWGIPETEDINWRVAYVNRSQGDVEKVIGKVKHAKLLIVNTPDECVIGGMEPDVNSVIKELGCDSVFLEGIVTVHCDAAQPVAEDYKALHLLKTTPPENMRFYSCYLGQSYEVTQDSAAESVLNQALYGFDFPKTIKKAYEDGVRIFLEAGPASSCTRMIEKILEGKPHLAVSACVKGEDDYLTALKFSGTLLSGRVPASLDMFYAKDRLKISFVKQEITNKATEIPILIGKPPLLIPKLPKTQCVAAEPRIEKPMDMPVSKPLPKQIQETSNQELSTMKDPSIPEFSPTQGPDIPADSPVRIFSDMIEPFTQNIVEAADAHNRFLEFSENMSKSFADTLNLQTDLIEKALRTGDPNLISNIHIEKPFTCNVDPSDETAAPVTPKPVIPSELVISPEILSPIPVEKTLRPEPAYSREMCMEFAIGSIAKVLGPEFEVVDSYDVRVRLPDEPLMLVDRIMSVEGKKGSLKSGKVVTEHDVHHDAWYLDGNRAPVCISIEAGQADLFLCSYLGIDLAVKGKRSYRLLDAVAKFHGGLPKAGETIRYEIEIDRFINQGETYLFFFHFNGFLGDRHIISMRDGCAGFFTDKEVRDSGGIVLTPEETAPVPGTKTPAWKDLVSFFGSNQTYSLDDQAVNALRQGDPEKAFGPLFKGKRISKSLSIPGGKMKLVDRVLSIDPAGGRYGLGSIKAQADIHPDDWFLTCHFVDDMVMPGTLMYECCMHTLRIFTMRMGWITDLEGVCCEPVPEVASVLKCRGPVTVKTKHVFYEVEIKEIGYNPEPYVIADAHMHAHDQHIVMFRDMSMKLSGVTQDDIQSFWLKQD